MQSNISEIGHRVNETHSEFATLLQSVDKAVFNQIPFQGGWSPAQVGDHIRKSVAIITEIFGKPAIPANRPMNMYADDIREAMLNFEEKSVAAPGVSPRTEPLEKAEFMNELSTVFNQFSRVVRESDLFLVAEGAPFPGILDLTRFEWVSFAEAHAFRHKKQLQNILMNFQKIA